MTYSFQNVQASISGPGGVFSLGAGSSNSEEGITIARNGEKDVMMVAADGKVMHSLIARKDGKVTVRLMKTSPQNSKLQALYDAQSLSATLWAQNVIVVQDTASGDVTTCSGVAFSKVPDINYATEGSVLDWEFNVSYVDTVLGTY